MNARSVLWSATASVLALRATGLGQVDCPPSAHDCCTVGEKGCADIACCQLVCDLDPFCCTMAWDANCVAKAGAHCGGGTGYYCTVTDCGTAVHDCCTQGSPGCSDLACCEEICGYLPQCCEAAWDGDCAYYAHYYCGAGNGSYCTAVSCASGSHGCCTAGEPGCSAPDCCQEVCTLVPPCCFDTWDFNCQWQANEHCGAGDGTYCSTQSCGAASGHDCCTEGTAGCTDPVCCQEVCASDGLCCTMSWDVVCVNQANEMCGQSDGTYCGTVSCALGNHDCCTIGEPGCADAACCQSVCAIDAICCTVAWDQLCIAHANDQCLPSPGAYCAAVNCPPATHDCCAEGNAGCTDQQCCVRVCDLDYVCCSIVWDAACVSKADIVCAPGGNYCTYSDACLASEHNCCTEGEAGCLDTACCVEVCSSDPFCCIDDWDGACVDLADANCGAGDGAYCDPESCVVSNHNCCTQGAAGCADLACCVDVCAIDASCCETAWDEDCVLLADAQCAGAAGSYCAPGGCGAAAHGCCTMGGPGCLETQCCVEVCGLDPYCCVVDGAWDQSCVDLADAHCGAGDGSYCEATTVCGVSASHDCCTQGGPGCAEEACCVLVCESDPFCCQADGAWDATCVSKADSICAGGGGDYCVAPSTCGAMARHDCCTEGGPGCVEEPCCLVVCDLDPYCCQSDGEWDESCVGLANGHCAGGTLPYCAATACPNPEHDCCTSGDAGCSDQPCCQAVCAIDPYCCSSQWDSDCVGVANDHCGTPGSAYCVSYICPEDGHGCCTVGSPGCNDQECCASVCAIDPFCCSLKWDGLCVAAATATCAGLGSAYCGPCVPCWSRQDLNCDGVINGADLGILLAAWGTEDPCMAWSGGPAVDGGDLGVLLAAWGGMSPDCADAAQNDCCLPGAPDTAGCSDAACCQVTCRVDAYCCLVQWDQSCASLAAAVCTAQGQPPYCGVPPRLPCVPSDHACCATGSPGCLEASCCAAVCAADDFCCTVAWDALCVDEADLFCDPDGDHCG